METAKRELLEETGMISDSWQQIRHYNTPGKIDWNVYYFVAADCQKIANPNLDAGEKIELQSTTLNDFIETILPDHNFREFELRQEIMSAFNPAAAAQLKAELSTTDHSASGFGSTRI